MRYTLKDYQADAVSGVLSNLAKARSYYAMHNDASRFALSAPTGAGKTVMAAAVIEALFFGSDDFDFEPDPGAVVLWFSDDPSLNKQSRHRLQASSSELDSRLVTIKNSFNDGKFRPGNVYFLNTQKLMSTSKLVRGDSAGADGQSILFQPRPDDQQKTIWDTITATIEDKNVRLYMVLDEAHRGMKSTNDGTIVKRLINGYNGVPPIPIVWGISATVERFEKAMTGVEGRTALPSVDVNTELVQASGLLKDDIVLSIPDESGTFDTVLLTRGVQKVKAASAEWVAYAKEQGVSEPVIPLLIVQVPNKADDAILTRTVDTIRAAWPGLPIDAFANVFGDHKDLIASQIPIPYVAPERVQDDTRIRILLAKDAISTGWDCPRAEVLVSFRPATDPTHITQLLGRMVRTPLARRIPGNELLNAVHCLLPHFNRETAESVARTLMGTQGNPRETGGNKARRVLFDPITLTTNEEVPAEVWDAYQAMPSQTVPKTGTKPVKRLTAFAKALADDQLVPNAGATAHALLHKALDGRSVQYADELMKATADVETVSLVDIIGHGGTVKSSATYTERADHRAVEDAYRDAGRQLSRDLARTYADHLVAEDADEDDLLESHVKVAAIARIPQVLEALDNEANSIAKKWFAETHVARSNLTDDRQSLYDDILSMSTVPERVSLSVPHKGQADTKLRDEQGQEKPLPRLPLHLLADEDGLYPADLNTWETTVYETESARAGFLAWYRNPSRSTKESLAAAYLESDGSYKAMRPDFIFFRRKPSGDVTADIVDPHGHHLSDALAKLRGYASYVEAYGSELGRVEAVSKIGSTFRVLDFKNAAVREATRAAESAENLYRSNIAFDYDRL